MYLEQLKQIAQNMVAPGKGVLAIDESNGTCAKRFEALGTNCTEETRRDYRSLLITAPGIEDYISGMILFDETLRQTLDDGTSFPDALKTRGIIPGIKVDIGAKDLAGHPGEMVTEGLDGLRDRLAEYVKLGAQFAKWRAVITIGENSVGEKMPSRACIVANCHALARYAALVQEAGMVPMVEPEVIMEGSHGIEKCYEVTSEVLQELFHQLREQGIALEGTILKTSMVISGSQSSDQADVQKVAEMTVKCLTENVPHELAGVVFLSGGQSEEKSTLHLNEMNKMGSHPWPLSFSYGRGIQKPALEIWAKNHADREHAQGALLERSRFNGFAAKGEYEAAM